MKLVLPVRAVGSWKRSQVVDMYSRSFTGKPTVRRSSKWVFSPVSDSASQQPIGRKIMMFVIPGELDKPIPQPFLLFPLVGILFEFVSPPHFIDCLALVGGFFELSQIVRPKGNRRMIRVNHDRCPWSYLSTFIIGNYLSGNVTGIFVQIPVVFHPRIFENKKALQELQRFDRA